MAPEFKTAAIEYVKFKKEQHREKLQANQFVVVSDSEKMADLDFLNAANRPHLLISNFDADASA